MEERLTKLELKLEELTSNPQVIKNFVVESIKNHFDDWVHNTLTISCITEEIERRYKRTRKEIFEYSKEIRKLEKDIEECKESLKLNFSDLCKMKNFVDDLVTDIKLKAYSGDVIRLERLLEEKCSISYARELSDKFHKYAKIEDCNILANNIQTLKSKTENDFQLKSEANIELQKFDKKLLYKLKDFLTRDEFKNSSSTFQARLSVLEKDFDSVKKGEDIRDQTLKQDIARVRTEYADCVRTYQFDKMQKILQTKTNKNDFDTFVSKVSPKVDNINYELYNIKTLIEDQEKVIGRLDEIILQKASKTDLMVIKDTFSELPSSYQLEQIKAIKDFQDKQDKKIILLEKNIGSLTKAFTETHPNKLTIDSEIKLIKHDMIEIDNKITYKADTREMLEMMEKKASWEDFAHLAEALETVHVQTKMLASQIAFLAPQQKSLRAQSQKKITRKVLEMVMSTRLP